MPELNEKLLEPLEKMKGIQKMEFGYFKHLTTLSIGSTLILIAFLRRCLVAHKEKVGHWLQSKV